VDTFTTPDPITGGNENPYTYPNDPTNSGDFSGLDSCGLPSSGTGAENPFCEKPLGGWADFGFKSRPTKPVLLGRYNGNFGKHLKSSRFTTLNISNWSPRMNDKYMRLVMSSGLRIITLDNPHSMAIQILQ
jgi:hypothetical protein